VKAKFLKFLQIQAGFANTYFYWEKALVIFSFPVKLGVKLHNCSKPLAVLLPATCTAERHQLIHVNSQYFK